MNSEAEFADALNSVLPGSDCFLAILDPKLYFSQTIRLLLLESMKNKVPVVGLSSFFTKAGAVISFDSDFKDMGAQAAEISAKVLSGKKVADIRPVYPRKYKYSFRTSRLQKKWALRFLKTLSMAQRKHSGNSTQP